MINETNRFLEQRKADCSATENEQRSFVERRFSRAKGRRERKSFSSHFYRNKQKSENQRIFDEFSILVDRTTVKDQQSFAAEIEKSVKTLNFDVGNAMRTFGEEIFPRTKSRRKSRVRCQIVLETFLLVVSFAELPERVTFVRQRTAFQNQEISVQRQNLRDLSDQTSFLDALADFLPGDFNDLFALGRVDLDQPESTDLRSVFFPVLFDLKFSVSRRKNFLLERTSLKNRSISLSVKCGCFIVKHFSSSRISAFKWSKSSSSSRKF